MNSKCFGCMNSWVKVKKITFIWYEETEDKKKKERLLICPFCFPRVMRIKWEYVLKSLWKLLHLWLVLSMPIPQSWGCWEVSSLSGGAEETNLEFLYLLFGGKDSKNSALPFSRRAAKLVFCYLSRAQVFKFSLAAAAAFLRGKLTSHIFLV